MRSFPFESRNTGTPTEPQWDRAITAEDERKFNKSCWENGVFTAPVDGLKVIPYTGLKIKVKPGACHIEGARAYEDVEREFTLSPVTTGTRIDLVVARFDSTEDVRSIELYIKEGNASSSPTAPRLIREPNYFEIQLAEIRITSGTNTITSSHIKDTRADSSVCGLVSPAMPFLSKTDEYWTAMREAAETVARAVDGALTTEVRSEFDRKIEAAENKVKKVIADATAEAGNPIGLKKLNGTNLDTVFDAGFYSVNGSPSNKPSGTSSYSSLIVLKADGSTNKGETTDSIQVFFDKGKDEIWMRNSVDKSNSWTAWKRVGSEVVNNLTSGGTDKALSAEQGKELKRQVDEVLALGTKNEYKLNRIKDHIIETGSNNDWAWTKWESGKLEMSKKHYSLTRTDYWTDWTGTPFKYVSIEFGAFGVPFKSISNQQLTVSIDEGVAFGTLYYSDSLTTSRKVVIYSPTANSYNRKLEVYYEVTGTWK